MKKGLFALACMFMILSCNDAANDGVGDEGNNNNTEQAKRNAANTREVYRAIETGDVSKLDSFISKDFVDHEGNMGKDIVGRDSVKQFLSTMHTYFDGLKMEVMSEATSADGVYHFSMVRMTGKAKQNPWGMPVGMDIDDTGVDVVKIKDGVATDHWGFMSMRDFFETMEGMQKGAPKDQQLKK